MFSSLKRKKKYFFWSVLVFLSCILVGLMCSFLLRISEEHFWDLFYYRKSAKYGYTKNLVQIIKNKNPNVIESRIKDLRTLINAELEKKDPLQLDLPQDTFKIVLIGDSMIYGEGVKEEERFASLLSEELNKIRPTQVFVLAHPGDHLLDNYAKFLLAEKHIHPDMYVFGLMVNDLFFDVTDKYPGESEIYQQLRKACPQKEFSYQLRAGMDWEDLLREVYEPTFSQEYANRCYLNTLTETILSKQENILGMMFFEQKEDQYEPLAEFNRLELSQSKIYGSAFTTRGGQIITPDDLESFDYIPVSEREGHPSKETHQKFSELLFNEVTKNERWKFAD